MFDWEENVFVGLKALYKRTLLRPKERRRLTVRATLKELRGGLLFLGRMLSGVDITLFETDDPTFCARGRIFLPAEVSVGPTVESNRALYELRTIIAALAIRNGWTNDPSKSGCDPPNTPWTQTLECRSTSSPSPSHSTGSELAEPLCLPHKTGALPELLATCYGEFPGLPEKLESFERSIGLNGEFWNHLGRLPQSSARKINVDMDSLEAPTPDPESSDTVTEIEGRGQSDVEVLPDSTLNGQENNLPDHVFEKTETLEEYNGLLRKSDDEESLEEQEEALREVNMKHLVRTPERPRSIYRADVMLDGLCFEAEKDSPGSGIPYPEWDFKKARYKRDWCFLEESVHPHTDETWPNLVGYKHHRLIQQLKMQFSTMTSAWLRLRRQPSGNEFDIDAVVNAQVELRNGHTPSENLYQDRKRDLHDVAAMILLDQSYSTDAWLNDVRVLDVINESIYCLGEVLVDYIENFSIAGFASNTRRACRFNVIKEFDEHWSDVCSRLGAIQAEGYTRIGPALRHAHEQLLNQKASRKIVILLTDGRPCDYDRYEGNHGIHDVKKAIETGLQHGIHTHAFAIEKQAAEYFPRMFVGHHFDILTNPDKLSGALVKLFTRLLAG